MLLFKVFLLKNAALLSTRVFWMVVYIYIDISHFADAFIQSDLQLGNS